MVETTSRATDRETMAEKWNKYARAGIAPYFIVHRERTIGSEKVMVIAGSAEPSRVQGVKNMV